MTELFNILKTIVSIDPLGNKYYTVDGELHRENGPAIIYKDGFEEWFFEGKLHRENGPARSDRKGNNEWFLHGERHREDGPAVEWSSGVTYWYKHGSLVYGADGPKQ